MGASMVSHQTTSGATAGQTYECPRVMLNSIIEITLMRTNRVGGTRQSVDSIQLGH